VCGVRTAVDSGDLILVERVALDGRGGLGTLYPRDLVQVLRDARDQRSSGDLLADRCLCPQLGYHHGLKEAPQKVTVSHCRLAGGAGH